MCIQTGKITEMYIQLKLKLTPFWMYMVMVLMLLSFCRHAHIVTFSSSQDPLPDPLSLVSFGIPHTQLWVFPPLPSNEARRQRPDYLH